MHGELPLFRIVSNARQGDIIKKKPKNEYFFFSPRVNVIIFYGVNQIFRRNDLPLPLSLSFIFLATFPSAMTHQVCFLIIHSLVYSYEERSRSKRNFTDWFTTLTEITEVPDCSPIVIVLLPLFQVLHEITS